MKFKRKSPWPSPYIRVTFAWPQGKANPSHNSGLYLTSGKHLFENCSYYMYFAIILSPIKGVFYYKVLLSLLKIWPSPNPMGGVGPPTRPLGIRIWINLKILQDTILKYNMTILHLKSFKRFFPSYIFTCWSFNTLDAPLFFIGTTIFHWRRFSQIWMLLFKE